MSEAWRVHPDRRGKGMRVERRQRMEQVGEAAVVGAGGPRDRLGEIVGGAAALRHRDDAARIFGARMHGLGRSSWFYQIRHILQRRYCLIITCDG